MMAGDDVSREHTKTVIAESGGRFSVVCSCGWSDGRRFESPMSAEMAWAMDHMAESDA